MKQSSKFSMYVFMNQYPVFLPEIFTVDNESWNWKWIEKAEEEEYRIETF